jgi:hypothetical protein
MLERRRPLPAGRYWADLIEGKRAFFDVWAQQYGTAGVLHGEVSEHFEPTGSEPARDFVIFTTTEETVWPDADMGFAPSIAGPEIRSSSDTVQRPAPEKDPIDKLTDIAEGVTGRISTAFAAVLVVLVAGVAVAVFAGARKAPRRR